MITLTRFFRSKVAIAAAVLALTAAGSLTAARPASAALPDLSIQRITSDNVGQDVTVRFQNLTAATGNSFYIAVRVCNSSTWFCQTFARYQPELVANQRTWVTVPAFSGADWAYACVDVHPFVPALTDRVNESNELNNCRLETFPAIP